MDRINAIRESLSVFACGLAALLPVIGFIPALMALGRSRRVRRLYHDWNPAAGYLKWGTVLAWVGMLNSMVAGAVIAMALMESLIG